MYDGWCRDFIEFFSAVSFKSFDIEVFFKKTSFRSIPRFFIHSLEIRSCVELSVGLEEF